MVSTQLTVNEKEAATLTPEYPLARPKVRGTPPPLHPQASKTNFEALLQQLYTTLLHTYFLTYPFSHPLILLVYPFLQSRNYTSAHTNTQKAPFQTSPQPQHAQTTLQDPRNRLPHILTSNNPAIYPKNLPCHKSNREQPLLRLNPGQRNAPRRAPSAISKRFLDQARRLCLGRCRCARRSG